MAGLHHFLLVYSHDQGRLVDQQEFTDSHRATDAYARAECEHRDETGFEIVLVGSDSIETIMRTHGHYFVPPDDRDPFSDSELGATWTEAVPVAAYPHPSTKAGPAS